MITKSSKEAFVSDELKKNQTKLYIHELSKYQVSKFRSQTFETNYKENKKKTGILSTNNLL